VALPNSGHLMTELFVRSLAIVAAENLNSLVEAVDEAEEAFFVGDFAEFSDPAKEERFKAAPPPRHLLDSEIADATELRALLDRIDRRWQLDAILALQDLLEKE